VKIKRITRDQLEALWNRDPEAVVDLFNAMVTAIENLEHRIEQLESQRDTDSHNSHKPPSSDGLQRTTKSQRTKSDRPSGGQDKHEGSTLRRSEHPDVIVTHKVNTRCVCGHSGYKEISHLLSSSYTAL
jgi:transposase